ncbi:hypothetical protein NGB36_03955 [Streptomyces sp. RB6PN25]|uniref:Uncharacterized protein n=1 Tax=Streptomyces humicola TaxID=2953240 RepID=A0ABT1PQ19_9ACTN|nr:hypothetical protein [Streptomyces humicola]MCQ4079768.1 hypothetical protein [Streptomyces humicola]
MAGRVVYDCAHDRFGPIAAAGRPYDQRGYLESGSDTAFLIPYPGGGIGWEAPQRDLAPANRETIP